MPPKKLDRQWNVIFCDSVRREVTGKVTIVGMVSHQMIAEVIPQQMLMAVYIETTPALPANLALSADIRLNGQQVARLDAVTHDTALDRSAVIMFDAIFMTITDHSVLSAHVRLGDQDYGQIGELQILTRADYDQMIAGTTAQ